MDIGKLIRSSREQQEKTQMQLAADVEMGKDHISMIELGKVDPQFSTVERILKGLRLRIEIVPDIAA